MDPLSTKLDPSKAEAAGDQLDDLFKKGSLGVAAQGKLIYKNCQRRDYSLF